jgi:hypothetical protein
MKLKDLKMSLSKMPADLDDVEVLVNFIDNDGKNDFDCLAFTGYMNMPDLKEGMVCVLGTEKAAHERIRSGTVMKPDGTKPTDEGFDVNK